MICEYCKAEGLKSHIYPGMSFTTCAYAAPYYDDEGKYHSHDPNLTTSEYRCSNGHKWTENFGSSCWCGWTNNVKSLVENKAKSDESISTSGFDTQQT